MNEKQGFVIGLVIIIVVAFFGFNYISNQANQYEDTKKEEQRYIEAAGFNVIEGPVQANPTIILPVNNVAELTLQAKALNATTIYDHSVWDRHFWYVFNYDYSIAWRIDIGYGVDA